MDDDEGGSDYSLCELCETEFESRLTIVRIDPYDQEICDECAWTILQRERRGGVEADRPTGEEYQDALREHPEPLMTDEELDRAEELGLYDDLFELT